jgi:UDP-N-acetylglucosamine--N-acetylmuramyl-(pentapeptide) pyrophosphoryl-undecaprenol N-acetylglucosamine transferase
MMKKNQSKKNTVIITGGHHNSAVSIIDWFSRNNKDLNIFWFGRKYVPGTKYISPEYIEVTGRNIQFFNINAGKLYRTSNIRYLTKILKHIILIPVGIIHALILLKKCKPDLIISFGGYIGFAVVFSGWLLNIRSIAHEQTIVLGLSNQLSALFVKNIYVSWPLSAYQVSKRLRRKMIYTGMPIRSTLLNKDQKVPETFINLNNKKPTLYFTGGKLGSETINNLVLLTINDLVHKYNIIWQCGPKEFYEKYKKHLDTLPMELKENLFLKSYITEDEIGYVLQKTDIIISRAGAHTIYEIGILQKRAIIIPIYWSSRNEQYLNAKVLEEAGLCKIINEKILTKELFIRTLIEAEKINTANFKNDIFIINGQERLGNEINKHLRYKQ